MDIAQIAHIVITARMELMELVEVHVVRHLMEQLVTHMIIQRHRQHRLDCPVIVIVIQTVILRYRSVINMAIIILAVWDLALIVILAIFARMVSMELAEMRADRLIMEPPATLRAREVFHGTARIIQRQMSVIGLRRM